MKVALASVAMGCAALALPGTAQAGVVVKSSGPSAGTYPVGTQVDDAATITLRAGDRITVLTDGGTRVMQGPGRFRVGEGATRTRARFSNLTRRRAARRARTGAVRGVGDNNMRNPNLWYVNVAAPGTICLLDLEAVRLWRPEAETAATYSIVDPATDVGLDVSFVETESLRALDPEVIALREGVDYAILAPPVSEDSEERPAIDVRFVALDPEGDYSRPDRLAAALHENGCTTQLGLLADTMEAGIE